MDAMAAPDGGRHPVFQRAGLDRGQQLVGVGDQKVGGARQLHIQAGVQHVGRGHALVHETRFGAHDLGQVGQEGDDVMLDLGLDGVNPRHVKGRVLALFPDLGGGFLRHHTQLGQLVGGVRLDLEPDAEFGFRAPDRGHGGAGIAGDHGHASVIVGRF